MKTQVVVNLENIMKSMFHLVNATMASNQWPYAFACGYVSGRLDGDAKRKPEHSLKECDEYALGYHKGYAQSETMPPLAYE